MERFRVINISKGEINGLVHTSCCHYSDELVEEWVSRSFCLVHALCELLGSLSGDFESKLGQLFRQGLDLFFFWLWMPSQNCKCGEMHRNLLSNGNVGKKHELLNHIMSINSLVL